jgi:glycosyltransferase involved in cell wall biosynthesis
MKVAIVNKFFFLKGGQETVALEQMKLLQQAGYEAAFFSMHHPENPQNYEWSGYFSEYVDYSLKEKPSGWSQKLSMARNFIDNPEAGKRFMAFLKAFQPDIIHCHGIAHQLTYSILRDSQKLGIPVVQTLHDYQIICPAYTLLKGDQGICQSGCTKHNYLPCLQNRCVKNSQAASALSALEMFYNRSVRDYTPLVAQFISPSRFLADKVITGGIPENQVSHIPNFLTGIESYPSVADQTGSYFLYIGRLSHEKGLFTLLKAMAEVQEASLKIVGDGPLKTRLLQFCDEHGISNVEFVGHLNRSGVSEAIQQAIAVILPSEWFENQPMSIIEAYAHGKPVIASHIGGIPEMVRPDYGQLFPPKDAGQLASIIKNALIHPEEWCQKGQQARRFAITHYNSDRHMEKLTQLYDSLMNRVSYPR